MYHSFASSSVPIFGSTAIEKSEERAMKTLQIFSPKHYAMTKLDETFGHAAFWNEIETELNTKRDITDEL